MKPRAIRFSEKTIKELEATDRQRGFATPSAFVRYAVRQELSGREEGLTGAEERLAASVEQVRKDVFRLARAQQALFAYLETLTSYRLCIAIILAESSAGNGISHC